MPSETNISTQPNLHTKTADSSKMCYYMMFHICSKVIRESASLTINIWLDFLLASAVMDPQSRQKNDQKPIKRAMAKKNAHHRQAEPAWLTVRLHIRGITEPFCVLRLTLAFSTAVTEQNQRLQLHVDGQEIFRI